MKAIAIYCADIGSVAKNRFGWARGLSTDSGLDLTSGPDIMDLVGAVAEDLKAGIPVALGFECPLFVPIRDDPVRLTAGRTGDGSRPWSAGAGAAVLATGLTETVWILREIHRRVDNPPPAFLIWSDFLQTERGLFLWEAFVSGAAKGDTHIDDATIAIQAFHSALPHVEAANAVHESEVHSLIGAALLRAGWSDDLSLLSKPCVVIKVTG